MRRMITLASLICVLAAYPVSADTIRITSGTFTESTSSIADFAIFGDSFLLVGEGRDGDLLQRCSACVPGTPFNLGGTWNFSGVAEWNGSSEFADGSFEFLSSDIIVPDLPASGGGVELQRTFSFLGRMTLGGGGITHQLVGDGIATFRIFRQPGEGIAPVLIRYDFEAHPVPEPATLLLLGSGIAGTVLARRRKRGRA